MVRMLSLPEGLQYEKALGNPASCFDDTELRSCKPLLNADGIVVSSGGCFAKIFSLMSPDGRRLAVKCFTQYSENRQRQEQRYLILAAKLGELDYRWKVDFELLVRGILVQRRWYPVLKMGWVDGTGLIPFIEKHLWRRGAIARLASRFASLVAELAVSGIAHGDLQHGNILVEPSGELRLVDYGGMFAPGLERFGPAEKGHEHYQSPYRHAEFGPHIDRFSAWVIYGSLAALAVDPTLWARLRPAGQERLLFSDGDFLDPRRSPALHCLEAGRYPRLRRLASTLRDVWERDVRSIPPLRPDMLTGPLAA